MRPFALVSAGIVAALSLSGAANAWKPTTHLYTASIAIGDILNGRNDVIVDGKTYAVPAAVAKSIRDNPDYYRAGVIGPDAFPDIPGGQGAIHPDNRRDNGTRTANCTSSTKGNPVPCTSGDRGAGRGYSYTWEWINYVYNAGWAAYNACSGCAEGERDLAFSYGFITHAAGDTWGHTFVNYFARAVFPAYADIVTHLAQGDASLLEIAIRHVVVEGYVDKHAPTTDAAGKPLDLSINAPTDFVYRTFIASPTAAGLGQGIFITNMLNLKAGLLNDRANLANRISAIENECLARSPLPDHHCIQRGPNNPGDAAELSLKKAEEAYLDAWVRDIDSGLKAYPALSLKIAQALFNRSPDIGAAQDAVGNYVRLHLYSMLGAPDQFGQLAQAIHNVTGFVTTELHYLTLDITKLQAKMVDWLFYEATGIHFDDLYNAVRGYLTSPATYIDQTGAPIGFKWTAPNTIHAQIDAIMHLSVDGKANPTAPWNAANDSAAFPPVHDTIVLSKLALLGASGLNAFLTDHGVAAHYQDSSTAKPGAPARGSQPPANVMLSWVRCIDCDHQWRKFAIHDATHDTTDWLPMPHGQTQFQFGEGNFFLWQNCQARQNVFRVVFAGWGTGWGNESGFPDDGDTCASG